MVDEIGTDAIQITSTVIYRRAPVNVLVSLDDPDALSFIRGGLGGSKERRERFKDMLDAGNELMQYLGMEPSKTSPGDIDVASDATDPGMGTGDRAALSLAAGLVASPMVPNGTCCWSSCGRNFTWNYNSKSARSCKSSKFYEYEY